MVKVSGNRGYVLRSEASRVPEVDQPGRFLVTATDSGGDFMVAEIESGPVPRSALHVHHHHDEVMVLLEGRVLGAIGDEEFEIRPGDTVFLPRGIPHRVEIPEGAKYLLIGSAGYERSRGELGVPFRKGLDGKAFYDEVDGVDFVAD